MKTIQDIFRKFYGQYLKQIKPTSDQAKTASAILHCKTADLGGHTCGCKECGHVSIHYNSCRDRHCPMCQGINKDIWVDQRSKDILNAPYFHLVFTVPKELHMLIYQNQQLLYTLMYKAVAETILELSADKKYLGAKAGFFSILHTWAQDLHYHPHIHVVVLAGGLTQGHQWRNSSKKFFVPVKVLSKKFRGKFLYHLKDLYAKDKLSFWGSIEQMKESNAFGQLLDTCYAKKWYSYAKETLCGPVAVIKYLGRYTHRIAISNARIAFVDENNVIFRIRGDGKTISLSGVEFIRRFLMHVLPKGFVKIRYYGILAHRNKKTKLNLCRKLTSSPVYKPKFEGLTRIQVLSLLLGRDVTICPACHKSKLMALPLCSSP
jgi:hypothetical protein